MHIYYNHPQNYIKNIAKFNNIGRLVLEKKELDILKLSTESFRRFFKTQNETSDLIVIDGVDVRRRQGEKWSFLEFEDSRAEEIFKMYNYIYLKGVPSSYDRAKNFLFYLGKLKRGHYIHVSTGNYRIICNFRGIIDSVDLNPRLLAAHREVLLPNGQRANLEKPRQIHRFRRYFQLLGYKNKSQRDYTLEDLIDINIASFEYIAKMKGEEIKLPKENKYHPGKPNFNEAIIKKGPMVKNNKAIVNRYAKLYGTRDPEALMDAIFLQLDDANKRLSRMRQVEEARDFADPEVTKAQKVVIGYSLDLLKVMKSIPAGDVNNVYLDNRRVYVGRTVDKLRETMTDEQCEELARSLEQVSSETTN